MHILHFHNVPADAHLTEIAALVGAVYDHIKIVPQKNLALVYFTTQQQAITTHDLLSSNKLLTIRSSPISVSYSSADTRSDPADYTNKILFLTFHTPPSEVTVTDVLPVFQVFGEVHKIKVFKKHFLHAFVQYSFVEYAQDAFNL
ncbi:hypothetical protein GEMRC1_001640 [Eukaryota sp. GEM-RC1]